MIIILEGVDGAGKSTLADGLEELIIRLHPGDSVVRLHSGIPTRHPLDEYLRPLTSYRPGRGVHYVIDRFHWGERVYPTVRGRPTQLDEPANWAIESYLLRLGAVVVMVSQYRDQYLRVYADRGDDSVAEIPHVEELYRRVQRYTMLPYVAFNWMSPVNGDMHAVVDRAVRYERLCGGLNDYTTYSGPHEPGALLFGDVRHGYEGMEWTNPRFTDPAFVPFSATSGHYLLGALPTQLLQYVGVANACDVDDPLALWRALGTPRTVALGRNAQRKLDRVGVLHGTVPHPQYVRRFHHSRQSEYGMLIDEQLRLGEDHSRWPKSFTASTVETSIPRSSTAFAGRASAARAETARRTT